MRVRTVNIPATDLRPLLFWAAVGVRENYAGSYQASIESIIADYAKQLRFPIKAAFKKLKVSEKEEG